MALEYEAIGNNTKLIDDMLKLVYDCFLRSQLANPRRLKLRWIRKTWTWMDVLQLWQLCYAVQVKSCEDFCAYLSGQLTGQATQKAGSHLPKRRDAVLEKSPNGPLMP
jgi:hypothetical protein